MGENSLDEFSDQIRETLCEIAENLLKTEDYKITVAPGSKKGNHND